MTCSQPSASDMLGMNSIPSIHAEPPEADCLFEVTLRRSPGMKMGIDVQPVAVLDSNGLRVKAVSQGGVVDAYNQSCPLAERIEVGDTLLVPGTSPIGSSSLMQRFLSNDVIEVVVFRGNKGGTTSGDTSVLTGKCSQLEGFPDAPSKGVLTLPRRRNQCSGVDKKITGGTSMVAYASDASTAYTIVDETMFSSVDSPWSTNVSEAGMVTVLTEAIGPTSMLAPIGESRNSGSMAIQEQEDDPLKLNCWGRFLARPLGSHHDVCRFEDGPPPRMGCMQELPPLEAILDGCDANDMVKCLPDLGVEELLLLMSGMRRPPNMEEVIKAHKLFAAQKVQ